MTQLKLSCLGHPTRRRGSLQKTVMLGKTEGSSKRARLNMREIDSLKEATGLSLQELSRAVEDGTLRTASIHGLARSRTRLTGTRRTRESVPWVWGGEPASAA